jgi:hypothetical protein
MKRRHLLRAFLVALLALQAVVLAPVAMAMHASMASMASADCSEGHGAVNDDCPCCPPGISTIASCAAHCLVTTAAAPSLARLSAQPTLLLLFEFRSKLIASQIYSPLNRPPIG